MTRLNLCKISHLAGFDPDDSELIFSDRKVALATLIEEKLIMHVWSSSESEVSFA